MRVMQRRNWVPDIAFLAYQLIADYRTATFSVVGIDGTTEDRVPEGDLDVLNTMNSWQALARERGDEWQEDDWSALVQELARRAARLPINED
jgi:hypothetical protein